MLIKAESLYHAVLLEVIFTEGVEVLKLVLHFYDRNFVIAFIFDA